MNTLLPVLMAVTCIGFAFSFVGLLRHPEARVWPRLFEVCFIADCIITAVAIYVSIEGR